MFHKDYLYNYNGEKIPYKIWFTDSDENLDTIVFLGTVQIGALPKWVAEKCPSGTAVVQGAPHWFAKDDGSDIVDYLSDYTRDAFDNVISNCKSSGWHIIADSQAAVSTVRFLRLTKNTNHILKAWCWCSRLDSQQTSLTEQMLSDESGSLRRK